MSKEISATEFDLQNKYFKALLGQKSRLMSITVSIIQQNRQILNRVLVKAKQIEEEFPGLILKSNIISSKVDKVAQHSVWSGIRTHEP